MLFQFISFTIDLLKSTFIYEFGSESRYVRFVRFVRIVRFEGKDIKPEIHNSGLT